MQAPKLPKVIICNMQLICIFKLECAHTEKIHCFLKMFTHISIHIREQIPLHHLNMSSVMDLGAEMEYNSHMFS